MLLAVGIATIAAGVAIDRSRSYLGNVVLFVGGAFLAAAAGSIWRDLHWRDVRAQVARTTCTYLEDIALKVYARTKLVTGPNDDLDRRFPPERPAMPETLAAMFDLQLNLAYSTQELAEDDEPTPRGQSHVERLHDELALELDRLRTDITPRVLQFFDDPDLVRKLNRIEQQHRHWNNARWDWCEESRTGGALRSWVGARGVLAAATDAYSYLVHDYGPMIQHFEQRTASGGLVPVTTVTVTAEETTISIGWIDRPSNTWKFVFNTKTNVLILWSDPVLIHVQAIISNGWFDPTADEWLVDKDALIVGGGIGDDVTYQAQWDGAAEMPTYAREGLKRYLRSQRDTWPQ